MAKISKVQKNPKNREQKVQIHKIQGFVGRQMGMFFFISIIFVFVFIFLFNLLVLRSQTRLIRQSPLRIEHCWVSIEPNFKALSMTWLARTPPAAQNEAGSSNAIALANGADPLPALPNQRRFSVASCRNIFEVDNQVEETGFDHLSRVPRTNTINDILEKQGQSRDSNEPAELAMETEDEIENEIDESNISGK